MISSGTTAGELASHLEGISVIMGSHLDGLVLDADPERVLGPV
ncbi:hypothetical protein [Microbacterium sp. NPDC087589]